MTYWEKQSSFLGSNSLKNVMSSPYCFIDWSRRLSSQTAAFWAGLAGRREPPNSASIIVVLQYQNQATLFSTSTFYYSSHITIYQQNIMIIADNRTEMMMIQLHRKGQKLFTMYSALNLNSPFRNFSKFDDFQTLKILQ